MRVSVVLSELQMQLSQLTSDLKEERVAGKRMKGEIQQLQDDLTEASTERDTLQKARKNCRHLYCLNEWHGTVAVLLRL